MYELLGVALYFVVPIVLGNLLLWWRTTIMRRMAGKHSHKETGHIPGEPMGGSNSGSSGGKATLTKQEGFTAGRPVTNPDNKQTGR